MFLKENNYSDQEIATLFAELDIRKSYMIALTYRFDMNLLMINPCTDKRIRESQKKLIMKAHQGRLDPQDIRDTYESACIQIWLDFKDLFKLRYQYNRNDFGNRLMDKYKQVDEMIKEAELVGEELTDVVYYKKDLYENALKDNDIKFFWYYVNVFNACISSKVPIDLMCEEIV